jgi:PIN domain nuclease of toxin-antitoxin system
LSLLLDTHILIWWLSQDASLSMTARKAITESDKVYVSAVSVWEIAVKRSLGKLQLRGDLEAHIASNNFSPLSVSVAHALAAGKLPYHHRDPFDRVLIAQANIESLTLITKDKHIGRYDVRVMLV